MRIILVAFCLSALPALAAEVYTFDVLGPENVTLAAGPTLTGWGYTIQNQSSTDWLVTTGLSAGAFQHATPDLIFDFPDLAPGSTVTVSYDPVTQAGLYQILWDQNAPAGFVNSGTFTLTAQWWSGAPGSGGSFISSAPNAGQPYTATATITPEPATTTLIALPLLLFGVVGRLGARLTAARFCLGAAVNLLGAPSPANPEDITLKAVPDGAAYGGDRRRERGC